MKGTPCSVIAGRLLMLAACVTMDETQCLNPDCYAIGVGNGAADRPLTRLGDHRRACAKYGAAPRVEPLEALTREAEPVEQAIAALPGRSAWPSA